MRFHLIDRVTAVETGRSLKAVKLLTGGEEYLADHFPGFPVMPGVLMLQALAEAASWLVRVTDDFSRSVIALREVKSVKYGSFLQPGSAMELSVELTGRTDGLISFKGKGESAGSANVTAQFALTAYNLAERDPAWADRDTELVRHWRERWRLLTNNRR